MEVEVISPHDEALFAFRSVQRAFDISDRNIAVADIGGGSTEIVFASAGHVEKICATQLGAVRQTELFGKSNLFGEDTHRLVKSVDRELKRDVTKRPFNPQVIYGTGGTFTALASMIIAARNEEAPVLWGYRVTRADVRHLLDQLSNMTTKQRRNVAGLNQDRADIIVAGLVIVDRIMERLKTNILRVHTGGVRDGLLLSMVDGLSDAATTVSDRTQIVEQFARSCGTDVAHARQVAKLSVAIFDQLVPVTDLEPSDRETLVFAALLQDVGYLINYQQHHKHTYQLIVNSTLAGFRRHELEIIANVARYHRGARPKVKHANFRKLPKGDRHRVRQLSAILRLAGALDRGHMQRVTSVNLDSYDEIVDVNVFANDDVDLEIWSARSMAHLFERAFSKRLVVSASDISASSDISESSNTLRKKRELVRNNEP